jgi:hypothetical protein
MDTKSLLTNTLNPQVRLMEETRGLVKKWDKTGLLDGLGNDTEKSHMAILLENQAKQLIEEASQTGTSSNSEQWSGVALPLVRRVFAEFAAKIRKRSANEPAFRAGILLGLQVWNQ